MDESEIGPEVEPEPSEESNAVPWYGRDDGLLKPKQRASAMGPGEKINLWQHLDSIQM